MRKWWKELNHDLALVWPLFLYITILLGGMMGAGHLINYLHDNATERERVKSTLVYPKCDLPCNCRKFYNLSTWEWADCMGVGRK